MKCPHCGDDRLIRYSSISKQQCSGCGAMLPWDLKPDQQPIVSNNRASRRRPKGGKA